MYSIDQCLVAMTVHLFVSYSDLMYENTDCYFPARSLLSNQKLTSHHKVCFPSENSHLKLTRYKLLSTTPTPMIAMPTTKNEAH